MSGFAEKIAKLKKIEKERREKEELAAKNKKLRELGEVRLTYKKELKKQLDKIESNKPLKKVASLYSEIIDEYICAQLMEGKTLKQICGQEGYPSPGTVMNWVQHPDEDERPGFAARFLDATKIGLIVIGNGILDIADGTEEKMISVTTRDPITNNTVTTQKPDPDAIPRAKLQIDTRLKVLNKLQPEVWGDTIKIDKTVNINFSAKLEGARRRLQALDDIRNSKLIEAVVGSVIITPEITNEQSQPHNED